MNIWNQDAYLKAWNFASSIHLGQTIPGSDIPYINHLGLVSMEATAAIAMGTNIENPNLLVLCALLHDSIEDTKTTFEDIKHEFGIEVANGVLALSKNEKLPTKMEQMDDSLRRIKQQPIEVWMVKLCDRITNLQPPPKHWDTGKISRYKEEAYCILNELGEANQFLAERLRLKIENYSQYVK
ncbi:bifunctional (p)ppGpp synthetase/guanosine-3',5'-bis(diphosphate) 3'-pyrophosphohydrolase [Amphritea opalescens]|uniref:Bifunctional (P)ppGpp synthetase/guanosine-3',5'-bis(Diphosphate) 3'-pyrophosphohydrolase n=1 Tax=Amphritea opalescens TaxID=2490544 RepID=A0A430KM40_9GAMM|nr:HD domain-containing protein [Amphritea opalescens]RTE64547.1 bifunctional (p)ppGpp synthetase/guanosine-3',5'-bis(diphosphate) 3'-pyrophosphohydrolase [Amphritea opalescens]